MKCENCNQQATGTFWVGYHKYRDVLVTEPCCDKCAEGQDLFWIGYGKRPQGFVREVFITDLEKMSKYLRDHELI
jgi:hypothetical protein